MKKVVAYSREMAQLKHVTHDVPFATVSIYTPPGYPAEIQKTEGDRKAYLKKYPGAQPPTFGKSENCKGILPLGFFDLEHEVSGAIGKDLILFDYNMAVQLKQFVDSVKDEIDLLVVHCDAGVSRSQAVRAVVLRTYLKQPDDIAFMEGVPNMLVYRRFLKVMLGFDPHKIQGPLFT